MGIMQDPYVGMSVTYQPTADVYVRYPAIVTRVRDVVDKRVDLDVTNPDGTITTAQNVGFERSARSWWFEEIPY